MRKVLFVFLDITASSEVIANGMDEMLIGFHAVAGALPVLHYSSSEDTR